MEEELNPQTGIADDIWLLQYKGSSLSGRSDHDPERPLDT